MIIWTPKANPKRTGAKTAPRGPMATPRQPEKPHANFRTQFRQALPWIGGAGGALLLISAAWWALQQRPEWPVREVVLRGELRHVDRDALRALVLPGETDLLTLDLQAVRARVKSLPWVREVAVTRVPPARLELVVEEHIPLARWQEMSGPADRATSLLVSRHSEVFAASSELKLPLLAGPAGSAPEVVAEAARFTTILGELPAEVRLTARHAWQLTLADGTRIELGRDEVLPRLERYVRVRKQVAALQTPGGRVDLRYPSGLAIEKTAEMQQQEKDQATRKKKA